MANWKKLAQGAAGAGGGEALNVENVFSTYLYEGTSGSLSVNNGIDLDGEGGMVWHKGRDIAEYHNLFDTERGDGYILRTNVTNASDGPFFGQAFTSTGFSLNTSDNQINSSSNDYVSWTFRKAPKFFDIQTWSGNGGSMTISHGLGAVPAVIIIKNITTSAQNGDFHFYHKDVYGGSNGFLRLNASDSVQSKSITDTYIGSVSNVNSSSFTVTAGTSVNDITHSGSTFIAYIFAHNDGDGGFGPTGDQDIIKCGSYTGTGSSGLEVDLGFEPQWLLIKNASRSISWHMTDVMRGLNHTDRAELYANTSGAEWTGSPAIVSPTPTGFVLGAANTYTNFSGENHIYIAIRRGPMAVPDSATDVFAVDISKENFNTNGYSFYSGFPVDSLFYKGSLSSTSGNEWYDRIRPQRLFTDDITAEDTPSRRDWFDKMEGVFEYGGSTNTNNIAYMWKRAPNFFDVVTYTGNSTGGRTVSHNLGVAPEMIWVKKRNAERAWKIYHSATGNGKAFEFGTEVADTSSAFWNNTDPAESAFTLGSTDTVNATGDTYVAYLFASVDGVSKVGSYTGNSSNTQNIDCGFSNGARFVMIKRTDATGNWNIYDTERGIVAGDDPRLELNTTDAQYTISDWVDPLSSGFTVVTFGGGDDDPNINGASYIFYAIA